MDRGYHLNWELQILYYIIWAKNRSLRLGSNLSAVIAWGWNGGVTEV